MQVMRICRLIGLCLFVSTVGGWPGPSLLASDQNHDVTDWSFGGHMKYRFLHTLVPDNSILQGIDGSSFQDQNLEARLKFAARRGRLDIEVHGQIIAAHSDRLPVAAQLPGFISPGADVINDDRRWFNLTHELSNSGKNASLVRLDRLNIAYTGVKTVARFGRQAISWGNGLLFTPMDIFNPFDPAAVDKEYKSGDDMLYGQYLQDNGNDIQTVAIVRRDPLSGDLEGDQSSFALKYHGFLGRHEYDLLASEHYGELVLGLGASTDLGGAVWRADLVWSDTQPGSALSAVAGVSYSGVTGGRNWTGFLEYYYNGFGQTGGNYSPEALVKNPGLVKRLARGELFNLGRHYLGASVSFEMTPLLMLTPNLFVNLGDPSALAQLVLSYDWKQDIQLLAALAVPVGPDGSEYGGIDTEQADLYLSSGASFFVQLAWYF